jgi:hypothetical protein
MPRLENEQQKELLLRGCLQKQGNEQRELLQRGLQQQQKRGNGEMTMTLNLFLVWVLGQTVHQGKERVPRMLLLTCNLKIGDFLVKAFKELLLEHHKVIGDQI